MSKSPSKSTSKITAGPAAVDSFRAKGWSYRTGAAALNVSSTHVWEVLMGRRHSRRLLQRIAALPPRKSA